MTDQAAVMSTAAERNAEMKLGLVHRMRNRLGWGYTALVFALGLALIGVPLVFLVLAAFSQDPPRPGTPLSHVSFEHFRAVATSRGVTALRNSLVIGVVAGALATTIGAAMAFLAARTNTPARWLVGLAGIIPLFMSGFVGAMAWSLLASPASGYLNLVLRQCGIGWALNVNSLPGIIFVAALYYAPYAFLFVYGALMMMNPELEEAALTHGAGQTRVATYVTLSLSRPALLAASVLTFALVMEDFPIPVILGGGAGIDTLPSYIYELMTVSPARVNDASAIGVAMLVLLGILIGMQRRMLRGRTYTTVTGKGFRPRVLTLGRWRWVAFAGVCMYLLAAVALPIFALLQASLRRSLYVSSLGQLFNTSQLDISALSRVLSSSDFHHVVSNTLIAGFAACLIGTVWHFALAYYVGRTRLPRRGFVQQLASVPAAVPALVFGIAFLWTWIVVPLPVYGTLAILVIAYVVRFTPQGYGGISSAIGQIHPDLESAARVSGAGGLRAMTWSTLPLMRTSILSTALLLLILSVRELSASIFLFSTNTRVLSVAIFQSWGDGQFSDVASMSLAFSLVLLVITLLSRRSLSLQ